MLALGSVLLAAKLAVAALIASTSAGPYIITPPYQESQLVQV